MKNNEVVVKGINVRYQKVNQEEFICLTDIAKTRNPLEPKDVIKNWMRSRSTLEYLALWENFYNPDFKGDEIDPLLAETSKHSFTMCQLDGLKSLMLLVCLQKHQGMVELMHIKTLHSNLQVGYPLNLSSI